MGDKPHTLHSPFHFDNVTRSNWGRCTGEPLTESVTNNLEMLKAMRDRMIAAPDHSPEALATVKAAITEIEALKTLPN